MAARLEKNPLAILIHEILDDLIRALTGGQTLSDHASHLVRRLRRRVGDRKVLAHHAAELTRDFVHLGLIEVPRGLLGLDQNDEPQHEQRKQHGDEGSRGAGRHRHSLHRERQMLQGCAGPARARVIGCRISTGPARYGCCLYTTAMAEANASKPAARETREWIATGFTRTEDVVYIGLAVLLAVSALTLLAATAFGAAQALVTGQLPSRVVDLLDRILLVLMIAEILYTVQVSFREHTLSPEPFLIVGLIAATRRILVITAEFSDLIDRGENAFRNAMIELGLLTFMVFVLVSSLVMLRRRGVAAAAERA